MTNSHEKNAHGGRAKEDELHTAPKLGAEGQLNKWMGKSSSDRKA